MGDIHDDLESLLARGWKVSALLPVGTVVRSHVSVMGKLVPMHSGTVIRDYGDGTVDVDRMSLHGGAPWVVREERAMLTLEPTQ